jgi:hypothetical protein
VIAGHPAHIVDPGLAVGVDADAACEYENSVSTTRS